MPILVTPEPDDGEPPLERCCFCWKRTRFWCTDKDVAVCPSCAETKELEDVPSKAEWCDETGRRFQRVVGISWVTEKEARKAS